MRTRAIVPAAWALLAAACATTAPRDGGQRPSRPNVILIMTDDQGYGDFSRHGNPVLKTPVLDRLAEQSIRLTDFHVAPTCTPTRGQLMTGLDALRNGASSATGQRTLLKRGLRTMAEVFRAHGYRTALYGKWHLGGNFRDFRPHERGFDDAVYFLRGGVQSHPNPWNADLMDDSYYHNGVVEPYRGYATDLWFDLGTKLVEESQEKGQPFFLYLPLNAAHAPLFVPDQYRKPYLHLDKETASFFGMIAAVDHRLGEFLAMLDRRGLREDTLLVFLTDNGTAFGEKVHNAGMRGKKGHLYEGGHRVPVFVRWPNGKLRPAGDVDALAQAQDLLPTLIDLCGLRPPEGVAFDGVSLAPLLRGQPQPALDERVLVVQSVDRKGAGAVLWRKWRLVRDELFDVGADPGQKRNVADQHPEVVARLGAHYDRWWQGIEPHLALERYRLGAPGETVQLTAYDWWDGPRVFNWPHLRRGEQANGKYQVLVDHPGEYAISLRRWPRDAGEAIRAAVPRFVPFDAFMAHDEKLATFPPGAALDITEARARFGDQQQSKPVHDGDEEVTFTFRLPQGPHELQTWFTTATGESFGAYYVYIERR